MPLRTAKFDPQQGPLTAEITFLGDTFAAAVLALFETESNDLVPIGRNGADRVFFNNQNNQPNLLVLPTPVASNHERILHLEVSLVPVELGWDAKYEIQLSVIQNEKILEQVSRVRGMIPTGQSSKSERIVLLLEKK